MAVARIDLGRAAWRRVIQGRRQDHSVFTYGNRVRSCLKISLFHTVLRKCMRKMAWKFLFISFQTTKVCSGIAIRRDIGVNFQVTQNSRVCSRHFKPPDYIRSLTGRKKTLKSSAVPSVFPWTKGSPAKKEHQSIEVRSRKKARRKPPKRQR